MSTGTEIAVAAMWATVTVTVFAYPITGILTICGAALVTLAVVIFVAAGDQ